MSGGCGGNCEMSSIIKRIHPQITTLKVCLSAMQIPYESEYRFHATRKWRFDLAIPALKIGIEYQGHGSTGKTGHIGGHASITGMSGDCEKSNAAQSLGWIVLAFTALHFSDKERKKHKLTCPPAMIEKAVASREFSRR